MIKENKKREMQSFFFGCIVTLILWGGIYLAMEQSKASDVTIEEMLDRPGEIFYFMDNFETGDGIILVRENVRKDYIHKVEFFGLPIDIDLITADSNSHNIRITEISDSTAESTFNLKINQLGEKGVKP